MIYEQFLQSKRHADDLYGFEPLWIPDFLFDFQKHITEWALRKGRAAMFEDCGLGKSIQELVWSENVVRKTNKPVLILTPLAVGPQMVKEGEKFGIECKQTRDGRIHKGINVTNYESIHKFADAKLAGVICDESSAIKHSDSKTRHKVTSFLHGIKYRLLATATPSPNDYMELGTSSEALGAMGRNQMLGMFFTNGEEQTQQWALKGHARKRFWQWVCTWARAIRKPSDLGFSDNGFILPKLETVRHVIECNHSRIGQLFYEARTLDEIRAERRRTIQERCEKAAELVKGKDFAVLWCHMNTEGDLLQKLIPGSVNVQGSDREEVKEENLAAFSNGQIRVLITKPKIGGWGLNWQHCNRMTSFTSFSHESAYQLVRRCWRFGQKRPVTNHLIYSQSEGRVVAAMKRKEAQMDAMFTALIESMHDYQLGVKKQEQLRDMEIPNWLLSSTLHHPTPTKIRESERNGSARRVKSPGH